MSPGSLEQDANLRWKFSVSSVSCSWRRCRPSSSFSCFILFLRWSFFGPIERVLQERAARSRARTRSASRSYAAAQEKERVYREALRKARAEIFAEQEAARRVALDERGAVVQQARAAATEEIHAARKRIAAETEAARGELEASSRELSEQIAHAVLSGEVQ